MLFPSHATRESRRRRQHISAIVQHCMQNPPLHPGDCYTGTWSFA
jgi:hypothetical protein